jgi:hypothetical protein
VPGASWLQGSGFLAWTMYSYSATYRLRVEARDASGSRLIGTSELARHAEPDIAGVLTRADAFRHGPYGATLEPRLPALAGLACSVARADRVILPLEVRPTLDEPVRQTRIERACSRE